MKPINIRAVATVILLAIVALTLNALKAPAADPSMSDLLLSGTRVLSQAGVRNFYL